VGGREVGRATRAVLAALLATMLPVLAAPEASADVTGYSGGQANTGWYPDASGLSPSLVSGGTFGVMFDTALPDGGQVYGQPVVHEGTLLVGTERNGVYGLDPVSGAIRWSRNLGAPFNPTEVNCADLVPRVGITSSPVVDPATDTAYVVAKSYVSGSSGPTQQQLHAIDVASGAERAGYPVTIQGPADNDPATTFDAAASRSLIQRAGLTLLDGVVYIGFSGHCDYTGDGRFRGWVFGVGASGGARSGQITARFTTGVGGSNPGGGVWQSGGALASDGPGQLLFATGNGRVPAAPTSAVPTALGQAVVRLSVQPDGKLRATDFFIPYDASYLNGVDGDFGSGAPVALPTSYQGTPLFGTASVPRLLVQGGKAGYVYLLDRDDLGGYQQGPGNGDDVVARVGPRGGVFSKPAVWPGNGGWVYVATSSGVGSGTGTLDAYRYGVDGSGRPTLSRAGGALDTQGNPEGWGFSSTAGVVTSNGLQSGSAIVWGVWSPGGGGQNAQLRAYAAVPVNGRLQELGRWPAGTASKFALPAVSGNRLYLGNRDGHVISYGSPVNSPVTASPPRFPLTVVNQHSTSNMVLTATTDLTVQGVTSSDPAFVPVAPASPTHLARGQSLTVPVTFGPTSVGLVAATLRVSTSIGVANVSVDGRGVVRGATLEAAPSIVSFGSVPVDPDRTPPSQSLSLFNNGSAAIRITGITPPSDPAFQVTGLPSVGTSISPGQTVAGTVTFNPDALGSYTDELFITTDGTADCAADEDDPPPANVCMVSMTGVGAEPAHLVLSTPAAATAPVGGSDDVSFTLTNTGGSRMTILKSKPPTSGGFAATTLLPEGTTVDPGETLTETVRFSPTTPGTFSSSWAITGDDDTGPHVVTFSGTATGTGPPIAQAGPDQRSRYGRTLQLDGSDSTSGDTAAPTYAWSQVGGPTVVLSDPTSSRPTFTTPSSDVDLTFRLTVRNTAGQTDTDDVVIEVRSK
jgi:hypothetical protein